MRDDGLGPARALLPALELEAVATLQDGDRAIVRRVRAIDADGGESSLVVKEYRTADEGWLRETAALESVPAAVRVSQLVASGAAPPVLVTEDLGDGPSVADALIGDDPDAAADAVVSWAEAIADLHVATATSRSAFRAALDARRGDFEVAETLMADELAHAAGLLDRHCGALGVVIPSGALDELTGLAERLGDTGPSALTPADSCPDNNLLMGRRRILLDFEGAQWRHVAWDIAYLRVPWPTCWCSWRLPSDVVDRAWDAYRAVAVDAFPAVGNGAFARDLEAATVGWSLVTASWFLDRALVDAEGTPQPDARKPTPTRRAMIMHRLRGAAERAEPPALAALAAGLADALATQWGPIELELAPAFRA